MALKRMKVVADFETTVDKNDLRVWAVCAVDIETNKTVYIGNDIKGFFDWLKNKNVVCYYHNLKFDAEFLLPYILKELKFKHVLPSKNGKKQKAKPKTFETLITDDGLFYSITVCFDRVKDGKELKKVTFYDSLKKLPFRAEEIAKGFGLKDRKLSIDYEAPRPKGHILTEEEKQYIINDCSIVAQALKIQFEQGLDRMTNASDALAWYKDMVTEKRFERWFPVLPVELDDFFRLSYKGGYTYLNPKYKNKRVKSGLVYDVTSLYPSVMKKCLLPFGYPRYFEGDPPDDPDYPLFIVNFECAFELKEGHLPMLQIKKNRAYIETEYLTSSRTEKNGILEIVPLTMTSVDLKLFLEHYETYNLQYAAGYMFRATTGMFDDYIAHWSKIKEENTGGGSPALRQLSKLMLNSLYGKFASQTQKRTKTPFVDPETGVVKYKVEEPKQENPVYTPMACFITAYARDLTIRSAQSLYDRFIYADTDSLHIEGNITPNEIEIHPTKLGAWKHEGSFIDSKYIRAKTYMETMYEKKADTLKNYAKVLPFADWVYREQEYVHYATTKVTCAGMPDNVKKQVTYDNFFAGSTFEGKLMPRRYVGGVILEPSTFTIK